MESSAVEKTVDDFAGAVRQRRRALMQRMTFAALCALIFTPVIGVQFVLTWGLVYTLIQGADLLVFAPIISGRSETLPAWRARLGELMVFLNSAGFGSLSIPLWLYGGTGGGVCAAFMIAGAALYSTINSPGSLRVMICAMTAHMAYLSAIPFLLKYNGASMDIVWASAIAVVIYGGYCVNGWVRLDRMRRDERAARLDAEARRAQAERVMDGRGVFLATIGHDLRTPISAILTGAAELEGSAQDADGRDRARLITDAGMMMKALLDDLLDHAKLEAGHLRVEPQDFDLAQLVSQTAALWDGPARAKGLDLRIDGAEALPPAVRGDPMRLRQVLNNLISNAMKFTQAGSVTLRLTAWAEEPSGHAVVIEVIDTGPGMSDAQLARLFTPFDQTADGVSARHGGTGLGLSISRQLVELMGGRLTASSRPGQGARFALSLNLEAAEAATPLPVALDEAHRAPVARILAEAPSPTPAPVVAPDAAIVHTAPQAANVEAQVEAEADERAMRVLIVDDHEINRRAIQLILQPLGCEIATAPDGMAALELSGREAFDLIFMDVRMPELDGRETTRRLRAGGGPNATTPVIAVTADSSPDDIAACMAAGMTYFVSKPITPAALLGAVQQVFADQPDAEIAAA